MGCAQTIQIKAEKNRRNLADGEDSKDDENIDIMFKEYWAYGLVLLFTSIIYFLITLYLDKNTYSLKSKNQGAVFDVPNVIFSLFI